MRSSASPNAFLDAGDFKALISRVVAAIVPPMAATAGAKAIVVTLEPKEIKEIRAKKEIQ